VDIKWFADIVAGNGGETSLEVEPDLVLSGETAVGTLRIALRDVSIIAANGQPLSPPAG
jgi:hypothetical protein